MEGKYFHMERRYRAIFWISASVFLLRRERKLKSSVTHPCMWYTQPWWQIQHAVGSSPSREGLCAIMIMSDCKGMGFQFCKGFCLRVCFHQTITKPTIDQKVTNNFWVSQQKRKKKQKPKTWSFRFSITHFISQDIPARWAVRSVNHL